MLSLYHVHILDLEAERRRLATKLEHEQVNFRKGELERKAQMLGVEWKDGYLETQGLEGKVNILGKK